MNRSDTRRLAMESPTFAAPWLLASLRSRAKTARHNAEKCRAAYRTDPMALACEILASCHDTAAESYDEAADEIRKGMEHYAATPTEKVEE